MPLRHLKITVDPRDFNRGVRNIQSKIGRHIASSVNKEGDRVLAVSQNLVPVKDGFLKRSGKKFTVTTTRNRAGVVVAYGTDARTMRYALEQHERVDYRHDVGEAKYLLKAFNLVARGTLKRYGTRMASFLLTQNRPRRKSS